MEFKFNLFGGVLTIDLSFQADMVLRDRIIDTVQKYPRSIK